jgi:hypothetical protein
MYTTGSGGQMLDGSIFVGMTCAAPTGNVGCNPLRSA